jgi:hypothetical protein
MAFAWALACLLLTDGGALASTVTPTRDDEVIEVLPAASGSRAEVRRLRQALDSNPRDARSAVALSTLYLGQARVQGDPRFVGQALAALSAWPDAVSAPDPVLLTQANLQQFLHDFDTAAANLEKLVARSPKHAQAWLTLATVRRVQGRYTASDKACQGLTVAGASAYGAACQAENDSLRGQYDRAHQTLADLLGAPAMQSPAMRNWLLTTRAESEVRAGLFAKAQASYREALNAQTDSYTSLSFADFLIQQQHFAQALAQLAGQPRTDAVLLRLAIAGTQVQARSAPADVQELRERITAANQRPEAQTTHAREQALFALWVDKQPAKALALARINVQHQREPLDVLLFAQAAKASQNYAARLEAVALAHEMDLHDVRLHALR